MSEKKELSQSFKKMKERSMGKKKEEIIRPEDMRDEEYLWYMIRKQWREEGIGKDK